MPLMRTVLITRLEDMENLLSGRLDTDTPTNVAARLSPPLQTAHTQ